MVQGAQQAGLRRRLAARLARNVDLLSRGRAGAVHRGPADLPVGPEAAALSLPRAQAQRPRALSRARGGSSGDRVDRNADCHSFGPARTSHPCVYRGFCVAGCSTNAKQSVLVTWLPRALAAGAEIRDLAMVGRIETRNGRATGVHFRREGEWHFQKARNVVVAGYAIETPRLLLNSANDEFPDGLANSSGMVGRNLMVQLNQAAWGRLEDEVRSYKGPPSLAISEHWNYADSGKDYHGGWCYMSQGPLPISWANTLSRCRGLWGQALLDEMNRANHSVGLKMVGEVLPYPHNRVTLTDETDQYGLPVPRVTYSLGDNEKAMIRHAVDFMDRSLEAVGATERWQEMDDTCHLNGTARMGDDPATSVVDADCRSWDVPNLWLCDGSVFPTVGGVNPSLTIQAIACRTGDRIAELARRGEL
ncbi:GMC oxidoreductase [Croceibacterium aestuarii]|uniref:GMC oxidoreductase n=1 Tax=Croceibacterium aestuarii TaxID=3064139 RepID=UPI0034E1FD1A